MILYARGDNITELDHRQVRFHMSDCAEDALVLSSFGESASFGFVNSFTRTSLCDLAASHFVKGWLRTPALRAHPTDLVPARQTSVESCFRADTGAPGDAARVFRSHLPLRRRYERRRLKLRSAPEHRVATPMQRIARRVVSAMLGGILVDSSASGMAQELAQRPAIAASNERLRSLSISPSGAYARARR